MLYSYTKNNNITDVLWSFLNTNGQSEPVPSSENKHNVIGVEYSANQYMWWESHMSHTSIEFLLNVSQEPCYSAIRKKVLSYMYEFNTRVDLVDKDSNVLQ